MDNTDIPVARGSSNKSCKQLILRQMLINKEANVHSPLLHLPFLQVNNFRERHDLADVVTRQQKNTNILGVAVAVASSQSSV